MLNKELSCFIALISVITITTIIATIDLSKKRDFELYKAALESKGYFKEMGGLLMGLFGDSTLSQEKRVSSDVIKKLNNTNELQTLVRHFGLVLSGDTLIYLRGLIQAYKTQE